MPGFLALGAELREIREMNRKALAFAVLVLLILCFIWGQSLLPHDASDGESRGIVRWLKPILDPNDRMDGDAFHHYLRKAAHFTEYAALGFCVGGLVDAFRWKRLALRIPTSIVCCIAAASVDECIQLFIPGRGPHLRDVLLDACGAVFGLAVFALIVLLFRARRKA